MQWLAEQDFGDGQAACSLGAPYQVILVATWLSMKEAALLAGEIGESFLHGQGVHVGVALGHRLLSVLLDLKHNGAVDRTQFGLESICRSLLLHADVVYQRVPSKWVELIFQNIKGCCLLAIHTFFR